MPGHPPMHWHRCCLTPIGPKILGNVPQNLSNWRLGLHIAERLHALPGTLAKSQKHIASASGRRRIAPTAAILRRCRGRTKMYIGKEPRTAETDIRSLSYAVTSSIAPSVIPHVLAVSPASPIRAPWRSRGCEMQESPSSACLAGSHARPLRALLGPCA
eukprot:scaffold268_cov236-Pinguiococcus_pyrenoidosus.AAC.29